MTLTGSGKDETHPLARAHEGVIAKQTAKNSEHGALRDDPPAGSPTET